MNTIKTIFVAATLLAVGYGTHVVLNNPAGPSALTEPDIWNVNNPHGVVEAPGIPNGPIELPPLRKDPNSNPFPPAGLAGSAGSVPNPFAPKGDSGSQNTPTRNPFMQPKSPGPVDGDRIVGTRPNLDIPPTHVGSNSPGGFNQGPPVIVENNSSLVDVPPSTSSPSHIRKAGSSESPTSPPLGTPAIYNQQPIPTPAIPNAQTEATFAQTWQAAQTLIGKNELAEALATLSSIYNLPMQGTQRGQLVALLDQLAGTVIYSQQHLMHPAYAPRNGETPAQIAVRQSVPADFLARVNGINPHQNLTPDMPMKIVTGPFRAEISRTRRELTVFLGKHYAGRFAISLGNEFPQQVTAFDVIEKSGPRPYSDPRTGQQIPAGDPSNPYGAHWIGLQTAGMPGSGRANCGLHSVGPNIDAGDSRGCIGLTEKDADDLKAILELGSSVTVVD